MGKESPPAEDKTIVTTDMCCVGDKSSDPPTCTLVLSHPYEIQSITEFSEIGLLLPIVYVVLASECVYLGTTTTYCNSTMQMPNLALCNFHSRAWS